MSGKLTCPKCGSDKLWTRDGTINTCDKCVYVFDERDVAALRQRVTELTSEGERLKQKLRNQHKWQCEHDNCMIDGGEEHDGYFTTLTLESSVFKTMEEVEKFVAWYEENAGHNHSDHANAKYSQAKILIARAALKGAPQP